jgi:hypothetical protein
MLQLEILPQPLTVCKVEGLACFDMSGLYFVGSTDHEMSLVCETDRTPENTLAREDGWRALRVAGTLDFSLTGILSKLATVLADAGVGIFAISTYDTDYILVKAENLDRATAALNKAGYALQGIPAEL